jgi:hypothetical protein
VEFSIACLRSITANSTIAKGRPHQKKEMKLNSSHQPMTILLAKLNPNNKDLAYYNKGVLHP